MYLLLQETGDWAWRRGGGGEGARGCSPKGHTAEANVSRPGGCKQNRQRLSAPLLLG